MSGAAEIRVEKTGVNFGTRPVHAKQWAFIGFWLTFGAGLGVMAILTIIRISSITARLLAAGLHAL